MMNKFILFLVITFSSLCGYNQHFDMLYGSENGDQGWQVTPTQDGNIALCGYYQNDGLGTEQFYLSKIDTNGNTLWSKTFGHIIDTSAIAPINFEKDFGTGNKAFDMIELADGSIVMTGVTHNFGAGDENIYTVRADANGNLEWSFVNGGNQEDYGYGICQLPNGMIIIAGATQSFGAGQRDGYAMSINEQGDTSWTMLCGGPALDGLFSVTPSYDGQIIATGYTFSSGAGNADVYMCKIDTLGNLIWEKTFGGPSNDHGYKIIPTSDFGYIMVGRTESFSSGGQDVYIIKTDSLGNLLWSRAYGGIDMDGANSVIEHSNGNFSIAGYTRSYGHGQNDMLLLTVNAQGDLISSYAYGGEDFDYGQSLSLINNQIYLIGYTNSFGNGSDDIYVVKPDANLSNCHSMEIIPDETPTSDSLDTLTSPIKRGGYLILSQTQSGNTYAEDLDACQFNHIDETTHSDIELYPNPATDYINVTCDGAFGFEVYNLNGQAIIRGNGNKSKYIDLTDFKSGAYFLRIRQGEKVLNRKIIKL